MYDDGRLTKERRRASRGKAKREKERVRQSPRVRKVKKYVTGDKGDTCRIQGLSWCHFGLRGTRAVRGKELSVVVVRGSYCISIGGTRRI